MPLGDRHRYWSYDAPLTLATTLAGVPTDWSLTPPTAARAAEAGAAQELTVLAIEIRITFGATTTAYGRSFVACGYTDNPCAKDCREHLSHSSDKLATRGVRDIFRVQGDCNLPRNTIKLVLHVYWSFRIGRTTTSDQ